MTAAIGSILLPIPTLLEGAQAAASVTVKVPLTQASWYWRGQPGAIGSTGVALPAAVPDPSVPAGDLAVGGPEAPAAAGLPAGPIAETYLLYDMTAVPNGSTITSFVISLPVDSAGVTADPVGAQIIACAPKTGWSGGGQAAAYGGKPTDGCDVHSPKVSAAKDGKSYSVDVAKLAQRWVTPDVLNLGVAITDNPANSTTAYQVVFGPAGALTGLTATVTYRAGPSGSAGATGGGGSTGSTPTDDTVGAGQAPVITPAPLPPGLPAEVAQPPSPAVAPVTPVVATTVRPSDSSAPPLGFWVALILIVVLLGTTTVVLADRRAVVALNPDRGVAKALRARLTLMHR